MGYFVKGQPKDLHMTLIMTAHPIQTNHLKGSNMVPHGTIRAAYDLLV